MLDKTVTSFHVGDKVVVLDAATRTAEVAVGKTGEIVGEGGFWIVAIDSNTERRTFYFTSDEIRKV